MYKKALLINEHGNEFYGFTTESFKATTGELIFNTAMTGFVEILSDPSYENQIICFTSSHIGNYGLNEIDMESNKPRVQAAIANSFSYKTSSWRSQDSVTNWLNKYEIPFSGGFDTRMITKFLRTNGSSMFALGVDITSKDLLKLLKNAKNIIGDNSAITAGSSNSVNKNAEGKIGILDLGSKRSIEKVLNNYGYSSVLINPKKTSEEIINMQLKGLIISNGPGDPRALNAVIKCIKSLIGKLPIFGICLGHQILSLSCGLEVNKMEFGHHGSNHPVRVTGIENALITSQNHGFAVEAIPKNFKHEKFGEILAYAINLYDGTNQGILIEDSNAYSVQFHPEAGPGTNDGIKVFEPFFKMIKDSNA